VATGWGVGTWSSNYWGGVEDVLVPVTGATASGEAGIIAKTLSIAITGAASSGDLGTVGVGIAQVLTGVSAVGGKGSLGVEMYIPIAGASASGTADDLGYYYWTLINANQTPNWTVITTF
jgi:hypothetical protein